MKHGIVTMNPNALKIGIVSEDPQLIQDTFWGLANFGYEVISANNFKPFCDAWELSPVDLFLVVCFCLTISASLLTFIMNPLSAGSTLMYLCVLDEDAHCARRVFVCCVIILRGSMAGHAMGYAMTRFPCRPPLCHPPSPSPRAFQDVHVWWELSLVALGTIVTCVLWAILCVLEARYKRDREII